MKKILIILIILVWVNKSMASDQESEMSKNSGIMITDVKSGLVLNDFLYDGIGNNGNLSKVIDVKNMIKNNEEWVFSSNFTKDLYQNREKQFSDKDCAVDNKSEDETLLGNEAVVSRYISLFWYEGRNVYA